MQAVNIDQRIDFANLKTLTPQLNASAPAETMSSSRKSFDDLIQQAIFTDSKPVEKHDDKPVENSRKDEKSVSEKNTEKTDEISTQAEKSEVAESENKVAADDENDSEKNPVHAEKAEVQNLKKEKFAELKKAETVKNHSEDEKSVKSEKKVDFAQIEKALKDVKKIGSDDEEKNALDIDDIRTLLEDDNSALFAAITASETILKEQNSNDFSDLTQISQEIFDSEINLENDVSDINPKTFAFDKDGKIIVKDYRTEKTETEESVEKVNGKNPSDSTELKVTDVKFENNNAQMTMEVASNAQQNIVSSNSQTASAAGSDFQAMLANQIKQNAGEFVKAGSIVLKDNNAGSIKLILKPESLGNVKVDLQISDKNITGRIVVASQEAFNAFKENADSLKQAFINSGFENANFDLCFAGQNAFGNQSGSKQENPAASFQMARTYGDLAGDSVDGSYEEMEAQFTEKNSVNIVA